MWRLRQPWVVNTALLAVLAAAIAATAWVLGRDGATEIAEPTTQVRRGTVLATVSAAGSVVSPTEVGLDFSVGGRLTSLNVEVGQHVNAGDLLATVDDAQVRSSRAAAEADVAAAQADLAAVVEGRTPAEVRISNAQIAQAAASLQGAEVALAGARDAAQQNVALYDRQVEQAARQLAQQQADLAFSARSAETALRQAEAELAQLQQGLTPAQQEVNAERVRQAEEQVTSAEVALAEAQNVADATADVLDEQVEAARNAKEQADREADRAEDARDQAQSDLADAEDAEDAAQAALDAAQATYDEVCAPPVELDEVIACQQAEAALQQARSAYQQAAGAADQARAALRQAEDALAAAESAAQQADDQVDAAIANREQGRAQSQQSVRQAETRLAETRANYDLTVAQVEAEAEGPTEAELAQAAARVDQAAVALEQARAAQADDTALVNAERARAQGLLSDRQSVEQAATQVEQARASLEVTSAQEERNAEGPSDAEVAQAVSAVRRAEAQLQQVDDDLRNTALRAPVSGVIASINGEIGELVGAGGATARATASDPAGAAASFITLTDVEGLLVEATFTETDVLAVDVGQAATVTLNAQPDRQLAARVVRIDPTGSVDQDVVEYDVLFALEADSGPLRPDQTATVDVITGQADDVLFLPSAAVETRGPDRVVTVVEDGRRVERAVAVGVEGNETVEILAGLEEGDEVLLPTPGPVLNPFEPPPEDEGPQHPEGL